MSDATDFARTTFRRALTVTRIEWRFVTVIVAIDALPNVALDLVDQDIPPISALFGLVTLYLQLLVTFRILETLGAAPPEYSRTRPTEGRYPGAFVVSLFTTLGILCGLVALVVPGVILFALWSLSLPALAAERLGASDAIARSWQLVRPRLRRMLTLCAAWFAMYIPLIGIVAAAALIVDAPPLWLFAALDIIVSMLLIGGAILWATAFVIIRDQLNHTPDGRISPTGDPQGLTSST